MGCNPSGIAVGGRRGSHRTAEKRPPNLRPVWPKPRNRRNSRRWDGARGRCPGTDSRCSAELSRRKTNRDQNTRAWGFPPSRARLRMGRSRARNHAGNGGFASRTRKLFATMGWGARSDALDGWRRRTHERSFVGSTAPGQWRSLGQTVRPGYAPPIFSATRMYIPPRHFFQMLAGHPRSRLAARTLQVRASLIVESAQQEFVPTARNWVSLDLTDRETGQNVRLLSPGKLSATLAVVVADG
jgi:hypothetical protein